MQLYDGDYWYPFKGNKGKRIGVQSARLSMCAFTTPKRFLADLWPNIINSKNGFADRVLLLYVDKEERRYGRNGSMFQQNERYACEGTSVNI